MSVVLYGYDLFSSNVLYTGKYSPPSYFSPSHFRCQRRNLKLGGINGLIIHFFYTQLCLGEFKTGRNSLQVKKSKNCTGRKHPCISTSYIFRLYRNDLLMQQIFTEPGKNTKKGLEIHLKIIGLVKMILVHFKRKFYIKNRKYIEEDWIPNCKIDRQHGLKMLFKKNLIVIYLYMIGWFMNLRMKFNIHVYFL